MSEGKTCTTGSCKSPRRHWFLWAMAVVVFLVFVVPETWIGIVGGVGVGLVYTVAAVEMTVKFLRKPKKSMSARTLFASVVFPLFILLILLVGIALLYVGVVEFLVLNEIIEPPKQLFKMLFG